MPKAAFKSITDESWAGICKEIALIQSKAAACGLVGVSMSMFYRYQRFAVQETATWTADESDAEANIHVLRLRQLRQAEAECMKKLEGKTRLTGAGAQWLLEHWFPDTYGELTMQVKEEHLEAFTQMLEMVREGKLKFNEVADKVGDTLAVRLFRIAGVSLDESPVAA